MTITSNGSRRDDGTAVNVSSGVAVVITTYNHARFLDDAITSVLAQTVAADEIIVVDDGSTDHPERVTDRYRTVRLIRQQNAGLGAARNTGWRAAQSEFVVFLDADDRLQRNAIEVNTTRLLAHPDAAFSYGSYVNVCMDSGKVTRPDFCAADNGFADFLRGNPIGMHATVMYRRSLVAAVGGFSDDLPACEDYDMYLRVASSHRIVHGDEILAEYRHHGGNMSLDSALMLRSALNVLRSQEDSAISAGHHTAYRHGLTLLKRHYVTTWMWTMSSAVRSREFDMVHARRGLSLMLMAPITVVTLALGRIVRRAASIGARSS